MIALGLGAAPLAGLYSAVSTQTAFATLEAAMSCGFSHIDTAPLYGHGRSERRIGAWLARHPWQDFRLSTKVGRILEASALASANEAFVNPCPAAVRYDYSAAGILRSFEDSRARLGVDVIDTLLLHDIGFATHGKNAPTVLRLALDEAIPAMRRLRDSGRIRRFGLGVNEWQVALEVLDHSDVDVILLAGRYTLLDRTGAPVLDRALERGTEIWAAGIFNSGLLAGGDTFDYARACPALIERRNRLHALCEAHGIDLTAAALQFASRHPAVTLTLVGARSPAEIRAAATGACTVIPDALWADLVEATS